MHKVLPEDRCSEGQMQMCCFMAARVTYLGSTTARHHLAQISFVACLFEELIALGFDDLSGS